MPQFTALALKLSLITTLSLAVAPSTSANPSPAKLPIELAPAVEASLAPRGLQVKTSPYSVEETTERFTQILNDKGIGLFATIDHSANATKAGLELPEVRLLLFGNPKLGTPLMQCNPSIAIDLPQKVLIWESDRTVQIAYNDPQDLADRHNLGDCGQASINQISKALNALTDAAISSSPPPTR